VLSLFGGSAVPLNLGAAVARADICNQNGEWPNCSTECAVSGNNCDADSDGGIDYGWICATTGNDCDDGGGGGDPPCRGITAALMTYAYTEDLSQYSGYNANCMGTLRFVQDSGTFKICNYNTGLQGSGSLGVIDDTSPTHPTQNDAGNWQSCYFNTSRVYAEFAARTPSQTWRAVVGNPAPDWYFQELYNGPDLYSDANSFQGYWNPQSGALGVINVTPFTDSWGSDYQDWTGLTAAVKSLCDATVDGHMMGIYASQHGNNTGPIAGAAEQAIADGMHACTGG